MSDQSELSQKTPQHCGIKLHVLHARGKKIVHCFANGKSSVNSIKTVCYIIYRTEQ